MLLFDPRKEEQRKNQRELRGWALFAKEKERKRWEEHHNPSEPFPDEERRWKIAHDSYVRQRLVNDLKPLFYPMLPALFTRKDVPDEEKRRRLNEMYQGLMINHLHKNIKLVVEPKPPEAPRNLLERLWTHSVGAANSSTMGTFFHNGGKIEIYPQNIRQPNTVRGTAFHEAIHYFDKKREYRPIARYLSSDFTREVLKEIYAQIDEFVSFEDPRRSAIIKSSKKFSRTGGWETEDPLALVRAFGNYKRDRNPFKTADYLAIHIKYVLGRAVIQELIRKGTVKRPTDIFNVPPEVLKKEMKGILARSPFIYASHFTRSILSVPRASMEKIAAAMRKKSATN